MHYITVNIMFGMINEVNQGKTLTCLADYQQSFVRDDANQEPLLTSGKNILGKLFIE